MNVLSEEDYKTVCEFKTKRNDLFHLGGLYLRILTDKEKEEIMSILQRAVNTKQNLGTGFD